MDTFESRSQNFIDQADFMEVADKRLELANDAATGIQDCMAAAQEVVRGLDDVEAGKLEVKPPLSAEQIVDYRQKSGVIIALGQKSVKALETAQKQGRRGRRKPGKQAAAQQTFSGSGSDAKK